MRPFWSAQCPPNAARAYVSRRMTVPIRIVIADDHAMVREGLRHVLDAEPGFQVVAEASSGVEAERLVEEQHPDVLLMDITMPGDNGLKTAARIRVTSPDVRIVMLSMHDNAEYVREGMRIGTHGYLLKDSAGDELRAAVRAVHAGGTFFSAAVVSRLSEQEARAPRAAPDVLLAQLTPRERDVLRGIVDGFTNKDIAAALGISRRTVEAHRESLMRKLDIHTVAGLTKLVIEAGAP